MLLTGQSDEDIFSIKVPTSQTTLACIKLGAGEAALLLSLWHLQCVKECSQSCRQSRRCQVRQARLGEVETSHNEYSESLDGLDQVNMGWDGAGVDFRIHKIYNEGNSGTRKIILGGPSSSLETSHTFNFWLYLSLVFPPSFSLQIHLVCGWDLLWKMRQICSGLLWELVCFPSLPLGHCRGN